MKTQVLDHGYVELIDVWGSDERIIEAARMSTDKGFLGWGGVDPCRACNNEGALSMVDHLYINAAWAFTRKDCRECGGTARTIGDERLLAYLWKNKHATPFEMAGMTIEVQAPIFVFREWHRHRTQCLSPDTLIHFDLPRHHRNRSRIYKMTIEEVWRKWQPTTRAARPERQVNALWPRSRIQTMHLRCLDEGSREIGHTRIVDVILGDPKPMVRVTTASGRSLTATREHRVLTSVGWMTLGKAIDDGALLVIEGTTRTLSFGWDVPISGDTEVWRPIVGWEEIYEVSDMGRVRRIGCEPKRITRAVSGYSVVALNRPGEQATRTVHRLVLDAFVGPCPRGFEARHKNHNRLDARLDNLVWGSSSDNSADMLRDDRQQRLVPVFDEIAVIENAGVQPSYDLTVEGPWHNFVADGFIVHNSYNEMSARYTPLPNVNYVPTVDRLLMGGGANKQAQSTGAQIDAAGAEDFRRALIESYAASDALYRLSLGAAGVSKELARLCLPVGRYSRMRASANLRNWLAFLTLRMDEHAQYEIRQYAIEVARLIEIHFPRTHALFAGGR